MRGSEHFDNGGYTYLRCRERGNDVWLAAMQTSVRRGETVSFPDTPPMINFSSKSLNRTFDKITFVPGLLRSGAGSAEVPATAGEPPGPARGELAPAPDDDRDSTYAGVDHNGTVIFTDDPGKVRKSAKVKRRVKKIENLTALANFAPADQKLVPMLEKALNAYCSYDIAGLKSITSALYWPTLWNGLQKEGKDQGASFLRQFCFDTFRAESVRHFRDQSQLDGVFYPFADLSFIANRYTKDDDQEADVSCTASFLKEKKGWKFLDILCGAERSSYP